MLIALALGTGAAGAAFAEQGDAAQDAQKYRNPEALARLVEEKAEPYTLVDVRTDGEYSGGHIPTAVNIPVQEIAQNPPEVPKDSLVIVYCRTGSRSSTAKVILESQGYTNVVNFGGVRSWPGELERI
jgi:rhodanese-related sulfurtransferase